MAAATLDGFIADEDDGLAWLTEFEPNPRYEGGGGRALAEVDLLLENTGALIMGSSTYEFLLDYGTWPYGDRPTWVLTSRDLPSAEGADIRFHNGPVAEVHPEIAEAAGDRDIWLVGGGGVASDLLEAGLLDEVRVTLVPIYLGAGKRLFDRPVTKPMNLLGHRHFAGGMAHLDLEPARPSDR
jgi:dihydrofolate reductase